MFLDKYPVNMYYSTSRRGSLNTSVLPSSDVVSYEPTASDWTCSKVRQPFDSRLYVVDGIHTDSLALGILVTLSNWYHT